MKKGVSGRTGGTGGGRKEPPGRTQGRQYAQDHVRRAEAGLRPAALLPGTVGRPGEQG